jgi:hypothetical protein
MCTIERYQGRYIVSILEKDRILPGLPMICKASKPFVLICCIQARYIGNPGSDRGSRKETEGGMRVGGGGMWGEMITRLDERMMGRTTTTERWITIDDDS